MNENNKPVCIFSSPAGTRSGYGDLSIAIGKSLLRKNSYEVITNFTRWGGCSRKDLSKITDPLEKELFGRMIRQPLTKQPEIYIQVDIPCGFQTPAKYNIGCTAGIETTLASPVFIEGLNRMSLNIATSNHSKKVFEDTVYPAKQEPNQPIKPELKSIKPIETLFWGIDTSIYGNDKSFEPKIELEFDKIPEDYNFLFVGQWCGGGLFNDRKDVGNLIKTFLITFANMRVKPKPALIIKTSGASICNIDKHDMINRLKAVRNGVEQELKTKDLPNVYLLYGELTDSEMNALYNHPKVKTHVSFTHGEGFGMPLLEASLSGKPILAPNWSGHLDFLDQKYCKLLDGELKELPDDCVNEWLIKSSKWFQIDYQKASESMKNCFYYYGPYLNKAEQLRIINKESFSTQAMDKRFWEILDKYVPAFPTEQKLILPRLKKISLSSNTESIKQI